MGFVTTGRWRLPERGQPTPGPLDGVRQMVCSAAACDSGRMAKLPLNPGVMERMVVDIAAASLKNARALLASAQTVLDAQHWPTSFSFAALALEEVGKASLCMTMLAMPPAVREEFRPDFEKAFTSHQAKAEFAHMVLGMVDEKVPASWLCSRVPTADVRGFE